MQVPNSKSQNPEEPSQETIEGSKETKEDQNAEQKGNKLKSASLN